MRRVLVTGSRGYIGSVLLPLLLERDYEVVELDAGWFDRWCVSAAGRGGRLGCDLRDVRRDLLDGVDAVVHLAGLSNDPLGALDPLLTQEVNCYGTLHLASIARAAGVKRFVFASTCSIYGAAGSEWVDEQSPARPLSAYAESKWRAEHGLLALADEAFSPVVLRLATVYGFSPSMRLDLVANNLTGWAVATGRVRLQSDGTAWRPLVHVRDVARAIGEVLEAPREVVGAQVFNVGSSSNNYRVRDLAEAVTVVTPGSRVELVPDAAADARSYRVRFDKFARCLPDAVPREPLEHALAELAQKLRELGVTADTIGHGTFARLSQLRELQRTGALDARLRWKSRGAGRSVARAG
ncbi:MAG: SDR family oxidoreductase [Candidatus Binatia bacterium]|nr:SDR family oxidoreductase [Candidatus Binatia bacterium]